MADIRVTELPKYLIRLNIALTRIFADRVEKKLKEIPNVWNYNLYCNLDILPPLDDLMKSVIVPIGYTTMIREKGDLYETRVRCDLGLKLTAAPICHVERGECPELSQIIYPSFMVVYDDKESHSTREISLSEPRLPDILFWDYAPDGAMEYLVLTDCFVKRRYWIWAAEAFVAFVKNTKLERRFTP